VAKKTPMRILLAPDKFKGSLTAVEVCKAAKKGIKLAKPEAEVLFCPLADGGEGTFDIFAYHTEAITFEEKVCDPLFRLVNAQFAISSNGYTAFIEMAQASGLELLSHEERNCRYTTTYGTGELICKAVEKGVQKIVLGIGGSATNDAGIGMAAALGYKFLDKKGNELKPIGENLLHIDQIDQSQLLFDPKKLEIEVACDVDNPLFGPTGAAFIYGPQKGASKEDILQLDQGLRHISHLWKQAWALNLVDIPGAGAAGGIGAGSIAFLGASLRSGIELVMEQANIEAQLEGIDLIITAEGKIDRQTLSGKVIAGICKKAKAAKIPVIAICGTLAATPQEVKQLGLISAHSILSQPMDLQTAQIRAAALVEESVTHLTNLFFLPFPRLKL